MIIYQNRKGEISMLNITIPVLNEFQAGWIVCQNKVNQIFIKKKSSYKPINKIKTHIIQG